MNYFKLAGMYYPDVVRPGDTVVEIGSYDGKRLRESELFRPDVTFHLFEPSPVMFPELEERFAGDDNVHCHNVAISDRTGPARFYMPEERGGGNGIYEIDGAISARVDAVSLSLALPTYSIGSVRLMLVNCEGAEFDIFPCPEDVEWLAVSFHRDKHPEYSDGQRCVFNCLADKYETVAWFNPERRISIWIGKLREKP